MHKKSEELSRIARENRINYQKVQKSASLVEIFQIIIYFVYPKVKDFQKLLLIPLGLVVGIFLFYGTLSLKLLISQFSNTLMAIFIVDVLVYQSRYQLNDILGRREDQQAGKKDRLPIHLLGENGAIFISAIVILIKCSLAVYICLNRNYKFLLFLIILIGFVSVFYELARRYQKYKMIFILAGFGYPLRFFSGVGIIWSNEQRLSNNCQLFLELFAAYVAFGCFSALLP